MLQFEDLLGRPVAFQAGAVTVCHPNPDKPLEHAVVKLLGGKEYTLQVDLLRLRYQLEQANVRLIDVPPPPIRQSVIGRLVNIGHIVSVDVRPGAGGPDALRRYLVFSDGSILDTGLDIGALVAQIG